MKPGFLIILLVLISIGFVGCDDNDTILIEDAVPATPQGVTTITGDGEIRVYWNGIYERDVKEYVIYRSEIDDDVLTPIGIVKAVDNPNLDLYIYEFCDDDARNSKTYLYAVTAVDFADQESDLSVPVIDTPRPDGTITLYPVDISESFSGFNFSTGQIVNFNSLTADVWIDRQFFIDTISIIPFVTDTFLIVSYLNAGNGYTDIQDVGYQLSFDSVSLAPDAPNSGWSQLGWLEIMLNHTYVIWTADNHFAKMWVSSMNPNGLITFKYGYQEVEGDLQLSPPMSKKPQHGVDYLKPRDGEDSQSR